MIRKATPADIPSMMELERSSATAAHWAKQRYAELFPTGGKQPRLAFVAEPTEQDSAHGIEKLLGFLIALRIDSDWELENIVVAPAAQRLGVGKALVNALLADAAKTNNASVFLEVRESNSGARALYEHAGFRPTGRRKSYYTNPQEDAVLYRWNPRG